MGILLRWVLNAFALWVTSLLVPGIDTDGVGATFVAALVLGVLNALLRPLLLILTLPLNVLTLGLFTFVVNGAMLHLTSAFVPGLHVEGFVSAVFGALVLSIVSLVLNLFVADSGRIGYVRIEVRRG